MAFSVVGTDQFSKCLPAFRTNIATCGSVTICDAAPPSPSDLETIYSEGGKYRLMRVLLDHDIEMRMCGSQENSLYDLFQTLTIDISASLNVNKKGNTVRQVAPFILGKQYHPINNVRWNVWNGAALSGGNYQYDLTSPTGMPIDVRFFLEQMHLFLTCVRSGVVVHSNLVVVSATATTATVGGVASTPVVRVVVTPQNSGSYLHSSATTPPTGDHGPEATDALAIVTRGTPNVTDWESYCQQGAGVLNFNYVPFWLETTRDSFCTSEQYEDWRSMMIEQNLSFEVLQDMPEIELNRQLAADFKMRFVEAIFRQKPISAYQTLEQYQNLQPITAAESSSLDLPVGGECEGFRANATGIYEQFAECGRLCDCGGDDLNLLSLFEEMYNMMRVRQASGKQVFDQFDIFCDRTTAEKFNIGMMAYYNAQAGAAAFRLVKNVDGDNMGGPRKSKMGFFYRSYNINNPAITINIITHYYFDDFATSMSSIGQGGAGRVLWIIDWTGIKIGVAAANTIVNTSGTLQQLSQVDSTYLCTMRVRSQKQTLTSRQYTVMVECPSGSLILENFSANTPVVTVDDETVYPCTTS